MEHLPSYVYLAFGATTIVAIGLFYKATHYSKPFLIGLLPWLAIQYALAFAGFYSDVDIVI
jgi:hypothetical protein